jgi:light-regulated signal transduction histidine kinase (bacteriophytochrome)
MDILGTDRLVECDHLKLNEIGSIQNAGCLLAISIDENNITIIGASENFTNFSWGEIFKDLREIIDKDLFDVFDSTNATSIFHLVKRTQALYTSKKTVNAVRNFSLLNVVWSNTTQIVIKENLICNHIIFSYF